MITEPVPRIILRPLVNYDAPALHGILSDPAVARFTPLPADTTLDDTKAYIALCQEHAAIGSLHSFAVAGAEAPDHLLGLVSASRLTADVELGCALTQAQWGKRLLTDAMRALVRWAAEHAPGRRALSI